MNEVILTIYIITYNHEQYIAQALESVLEQDMNFKYEILVGDDCSTDNTLNIVKDYQSKYPDIISVLKHDINVGASRNIFDLLMLSKGKYITRLEGDDYWEKTNQLQYSIDFLEAHSEFIGISRVSKTISERSGKIINIGFSKNLGSATLKSYLMGQGTFTSIHRNFYKLGQEDYSIIYTANRMVAEIVLGFLEIKNGDIYLTNEAWEVKRGDRIKTATNYNSTHNYREVFAEIMSAYDAIEKQYPQYNMFFRRYPKIVSFFWESYFDGDTNKFWKYIKPYNLYQKTRIFMCILNQLPKIYWQRISYKVKCLLNHREV